MTSRPRSSGSDRGQHDGDPHEEDVGNPCGAWKLHRRRLRAEQHHLQIDVDASASSTHNSLGTLRTLSSGNETTSRLVFRGTEDLGDGLRVGFWLESTVMSDTGTVGGVANLGLRTFS